MPLRCFVASAFGRRDVDTMFDDAISPVLQGMDILPVRVDRIEHNDDIDNRIVLELDRADLCIADLTYARPSVYYEAGYSAGKGISVIYTCRKDHFQARANEKSDYLRVHFDLQMKNIIPWSTPDRSFRQKLTRRVRYVARPLFLKMNRQQTSRAIEAKFHEMSRREKFERFAVIAEKSVRKKGFQFGRGISGRAIVLDTFVSMHAMRRDKDEVQIVIVEVHEYLSRRDLEGFGIFNQPHTPYLIAKLGEAPFKREIKHAFLVSLKPVPIDRVAQALPHFSADPEIRRFSHTVVLKDGTEQTVDLHIIDDITSVEDFAARFTSRMRLIKTK